MQKRVRDVTPDELIYEKFIEGLSIAEIASEHKKQGLEIELRLRAVMIGVRIGVRMCSGRDRNEDDV